MRILEEDNEKELSTKVIVTLSFGIVDRFSRDFG